VVQASATSCANHRRRPKVAACGACGDALCADCVVHTSVGVKCGRCTGVGGGGRGPARHVSSAPGRSRTGPAAGRGRAVALLAAGLVVVALAGYALVSGGSGSGSGSGSGTGAGLDLASGPTERNSEFVGAGGQRLGGTLTLPGAAAGEKGVPAVLIVPGLGAVDRNSVMTAGTADGANDALASSLNASSPGPVDPLYQDLSQVLADVGVASFRYDKRGTARAQLAPGQKLSFDDEVADAKAALDFLARRSEVGPAPLGVVGHDEGGLVALRAAAGNPRVKGAVLVSTPGRPLVDVLADDFTRSRGAAVGDQLRAAVASMQASGKVPAPETLPALLRPLFPPGSDPYLASLFSLDPADEAAAATAGALLVRGGADRTVTGTDTDRLSAAFKGGAEVLVATGDADHNLSFGAGGHEHSNAAGAPVSHRDADAGARLAAWVKARLTA
jgi:pimeloyl-ACP methyl ester carboxylesterase